MRYAAFLTTLALLAPTVWAEEAEGTEGAEAEIGARIEALAERLASASFEERAAAAEELEAVAWEHADVARSWLPRVIAGTKSLEARRRLERCLVRASGGRWRALPEAPIATRYGDARLVLPDGRLFLWGGFSFRDREPKLYADGAIFDPKTRAWTKIADAPLAARLGATALAVGERVFVTGGGRRVWAALDGKAPRDAAWYDPAKDTWTRVPDVPRPAGQEAIGATEDGRVVVFGIRRGDPGFAGAVLDPDEGTWTALPACPLSGRREPAVMWTGRHLVVWGGRVSDGRDEGALADGATWDAASGTWSEMPEVPIGGRGGARSIVLDGRCFVLGGGAEGGKRDGFRFDPATGDVKPVADAAHPLGRLVLLGRVILAVEPKHASILDPGSLRWSPPIIEGEGESVRHAGLVGDDPVFLVADGTVRRFDLRRFRWRPSAPVPEGALRHVPTFHPDGLFLWGGGDVPTSGMLSPGRMFDGGWWYEPPPK